jgi:predicted ATPase
MGQALLQDCKPTTFIADEPELSLHVLWQERLVECVRELNPAAQIIFATHSPDIVGKYNDRVIDVSKVLAK